MANIKSAIKRVKIAKAQTLRNSIVKSMLKTCIRKLDESLKAGDEAEIKEQFIQATKQIDKAAAKGVIHKNTAARKKSLISKKLNQANAANA